MDIEKIKQLIDVMASSDLTDLEFAEDGWTLKLSRSQAQAQSQSPILATPPQQRKPFVAAAAKQSVAPVAPPSPTVELPAPLAGIVYLQPAPDKPPFVAVGQMVRAGTPICVIEAMKVFNEVRADTDGVVEAIMVTSGREIDAGQPLVRLSRRAA